VKGVALTLGAVRLVMAASIITAVAYVLSWQILWGGMVGTEAPFHLHLVDWVAKTFPNLPWWYPWDAMGVSYREAYPLASHWLAVAASRAFSTNLEGGAQVVQFAIMPLSALGLYAFFDWRLKRPVAGIIAGLLFLVSPLPWVEWTRFGLYASWVGIPLFMAAVIALDAFYFAWLAGDRGWRLRAGAAGFVGLTTLMGMVSPHLLAAPLLVVPAYALAVQRASARRAWRWILTVVPAVWAGVVLLSLFWLGAELQYLSVVRSHWAGAGTNFEIDRLVPIDLSNLLSFSPLKPLDLGSLYSVSPAVLLPAVAGSLLSLRDGRTRMFLALAVVSILLMTVRDLYRPFFAVPGFAEFAVVAHRPFQLLASFALPALASIGLVELPRHAIDFIAARSTLFARSRWIAVSVIAIVVASALIADVAVFAGRVQGEGSLLAYGPSLATPHGAPDLRDMWERNKSAPLGQQLFDRGLWRMPAVKCDLGCPAAHQALTALGATFPSPAQRLDLNSDIGQLDMAYHLLTGGGTAHSYNDQVLPSRELSSWLEENMLQTSGTTIKGQLAQALGIDAVVLSNQQADRAADFTAMGWTKVSQRPLAFVNPQPSGLAAQWQSGTAVLVVGKTQASVPALYNFVFKRASTGALPFASAWLVRGTSPNIDDYPDAELSRYSGVILLGYQYHDQATAWTRLDRYVRAGGHLFIETGWQYVDPDWDLGKAPTILPVGSARWSVLDPSAAVQIDGAADPQFGRFVYGSGGWSAGAAASVRPGATELVRVGDRVVAARWEAGRGRVMWSGMNLMAHDATSGSADEDRFLAAQFAWLFEPAASAGPQVPIQPEWNGSDQVTLALQPSTGPTLILLKESLFPGWSARLVTQSGSTDVDLVGSEMDFMLAKVGSVPPGSTLVFTFGPTIGVYVSWAIATATLGAMLTWLVRPRWFLRLNQGIRERVSARFGWSEEEG
jgi:hypothetical protein